MKRLGHLFDILLLMINSIGIVGALTEILQIPWRNDFLEGVSKSGALDGRIFWLILFLFCVISILLWRGAGGKRLFWRVGFCILLYICLGLVFAGQLQGGIVLVLQNAVGNLNGRYSFHIAWTPAARILQETGWSDEGAVWASTFGALYLLFPFELLAGLFWKYGKVFLLLGGNVLWFTAACACDIFPGFFFLIFCVLGIAAALIQGDFRDNPGAGMRAVTGMTAFLGIVLAAVYFFLLPVLDWAYEVTEQKRMEFYILVNHDWIPRVQSVFSGYGPGLGSGPDVTGELYRNNVFSYTANEVYQVTVDRIPQSSIYLKGFVGASYGGKAWEESPDREIKEYYEEHGLELPEDYRDLVNMSYGALGRLQPGVSPGYIRLEELGGKGSYSLYPYGALLTEEYRAHGDTSVEREGASYDFRYYFPAVNGGDLGRGAYSGFEVGLFSGGNSDYGENADLQEKWVRVERDYRRYVYDSFLDYPEEELPLLTRRLSQEKVNLENVADCVLSVMGLLKEQAVYNLDAGRNPSGTDFVEYFLFESGEGYCAHFASAAVLALRYYGIPARYVTGYAVSPSDFSADGEGGYRAVLTGRQAHAWTEIYLDGIGWIPVEMTPGAVALSGNGYTVQREQAQQLTGQSIPAPEREEMREEEGTATPGLPEDSLPEIEELPQETLPKQEVSGENQQGQTGQEFRNSPMPGLQGEEEGSESGGVAGRLLLYPPAVLLLLLAMVLLDRRQKRRRRELLGKAGTGERIYLLYQNLRAALRVMGCPRRLAVEEEAFWQALLRIFPQVTRQEYDALCGILEKNTFGNVTPSEEELQAVHSLHDRLIAGVYESAPLYKKMLLGRYREACMGER